MMVTEKISKHSENSAMILSTPTSHNVDYPGLDYCRMRKTSQLIDSFRNALILSVRYWDQVEEAYTLLQLQYSGDPQGGNVLIYG